jgi:hypothetical protein
MDHRDEVARRYGFNSGVELLAGSKPIPQQPGDTGQVYVTRAKTGRWIVWVDGLCEEPGVQNRGDGTCVGRDQSWV